MKLIKGAEIKAGAWIWTCSLSKKGDFGIFGGMDQKIQLVEIKRNAKTGQAAGMTIIPGARAETGGCVWSAKIFPDGKAVLIPSDDDQTARIAKIQRQKNGKIAGLEVIPNTILKVNGPIFSCDIFPDQEFIVLGTGGKDRKIYTARVSRDAKTNEITGLTLLDKEPLSLSGEVYCLQISPDQDFLAAGSSDQKLSLFKSVFNIQTKIIERLEIIPQAVVAVGGQVYACQITPDKKYVVFGGEEGIVYLAKIFYDAQGQGVEKAILVPGAEVRIGDSVDSLSIAPDQSFILAGTSNREVNFLELLRDSKTGEIIQLKREEKLTFPVEGRVTCCSVDKDQTFVLVGSGFDKKVRLLDISAPALKQERRKARRPISTTVTLQRQKKEAKFPPSQEEYQQQQKLLFALQEVARGLAEGKDIQTILTLIAAILGKALGAKWVNFWDITPDRKGVYITAAYGMDPSYMAHSRVDPIPMGQGWIGKAVETKRNWGTSDSLNDPEGVRTWMKGVMKMGIRAIMCLPLIAKGASVGGMCVYYDEVHPYSDFEMRIADIVADQVATALENVRIQEDLQTRIEELEKFRQATVGREIKMVELKKEIEALRGELEKYKTGA